MIPSTSRLAFPSLRNNKSLYHNDEEGPANTVASSNKRPNLQREGCPSVPPKRRRMRCPSPLPIKEEGDDDDDGASWMDVFFTLVDDSYFPEGVDAIMSSTNKPPSRTMTPIVSPIQRSKPLLHHHHHHIIPPIVTADYSTTTSTNISDLTEAEPPTLLTLSSYPFRIVQVNDAFSDLFSNDDDDDLPIVPRLSQYSSLSRLDQEPVMIENAQYSMEVVPIIIITNNNNNDPTRTLQNYSVRFHRVMDNKS